MTNAAPRRSPVAQFFSAQTNVFTQIGTMFVFLFFVFSIPDMIRLPEAVIFYLSDLASYFIDLVRWMVAFLAWLAALAAVALTVFGRKNIGFLVAVGSFLVTLIVNLSIGIDIGYIFQNLTDLGFSSIAWLVANFLAFPLAIVLLIVGRPEIQRGLGLK
jgi:hypothetical protein